MQLVQAKELTTYHHNTDKPSAFIGRLFLGKGSNTSLANGLSLLLFLGKGSNTSLAKGLSLCLVYFSNQAKVGGAPNVTMLEYTEITM